MLRDIPLKTTHTHIILFHHTLSLLHRFPLLLVGCEGPCGATSTVHIMFARTEHGVVMTF